MKTIIITKIGYSSGAYGCTGEHYLAIIITNECIDSFYFTGLYGANERVMQVFKEQGYSDKYVGNLYGKMTKKDLPSKIVLTEYSAIDYAKELLEKYKALFD